MTEIEIDLPIAPCGKGRPRFTRTGRVYTPAKTAQFERSVRALLKNYLGPQEPMKGGVRVIMTFYFARPKKPTHPYPSNFDTDNCSKAILDAANGVVWKDDNQIVKYTASKAYTDEAPHIYFYAVAA